MQKQPVLFISPLPPPQGGIATWTQKIVTEGLPDNTPVTLVDTRIRGARNIFDPAFFSLAEISRTLRIYFLLIFQLVMRRPKLIHLSCALSSAGVFRDAICVLLAKCFRVPVVIHYHGNMHDFNAARFGGRSGKVLTWLLRQAAINIVANQPSFDFAKTYAAVNNLVLLPNFIEDSIFDLQKSPVQDRQHLRALYAGGITTAKGSGELLQMAKRFPTIEFHLFGKMHADMAGIYQSATQNIVLHGEVPHATLLEEMAQSDFLLFPSYTEGFPLTVLEAMAIGLPVIATTVGGIPEMIIENAGGYLVPPRDSEALAQAIQNLVDQPQQIMAFGQYNKHKSQTEFSYSTVMARLLIIYQQLYSGKATCAV